MSDPSDTPLSQAPKHVDEVRFLVESWAFRFLLIGMPLTYGVLILGSYVNAPNESWLSHILLAALFPVPASAFLIYRIAKEGYLILDPKRGELVISGQTISFDRLENPRVAEREVEFMSTMWHSTRGTGEGLEIAPGKIILFNSGYSRRKLERIADLLAEMLEEFKGRQTAQSDRTGSPQAPPLSG